MSGYAGKIVAVTGAASGIGWAICRRFAAEGAAIALLDLDGVQAEARASELRAGGTDARAYPCDVTSEEQCRAAIGQAIADLGGIDVLVANAGITLREAFVSTEAAAFRRVMDVNFFGALYVTQAAISSLIARRGAIVVTSSIAGLAPLLGRSGYCASKHALHGLFGTLRVELRQEGVHVLIVSPGFVATNLQKHALGGDGEVTDHPQSTVGAVETADGVADAVIEGLRKRRRLLVLSRVGKLARWLSFLAPGLYERQMERKLRKELER